MALPHRSRPEDWPVLPAFAEWQETCATFHLWTQVVGKIRLVQTPWLNHSWHVPLYVTTRGLGTSPIPHGARSFEMDFDLQGDALRIHTADGEERHVALAARPVADFYADVMAALDGLGLRVRIHTTPSEIADAIPFEQDRTHAHYDGDAVRAFWHALVQSDRVLKEFRARFLGKCSPVHFFWGSFDLAVTRFSGREAPPHPGGVPNFPDWVAREAYSHEVSSAGLFAGGPGVEAASFYAYAYPAPEGFDRAPVAPQAATYSRELGEFLLPYEAVRRASSPDETLLAFLQSTYEAAADRAGWDRAALERDLPPRA
jgi:hypothetical protein